MCKSQKQPTYQQKKMNKLPLALVFGLNISDKHINCSTKSEITVQCSDFLNYDSEVIQIFK
jgi:hypothetical protein